MRFPILLFATVLLYSCNQNNDPEPPVISKEAQRIDSINAARKKWNDSIAIKNQQNNFEDESGVHLLKYSSDNVSGFSGEISFTKKDRDLYEISGDANSGQNSLKITGEIKKVSEKHLNFKGEIMQKINGEIFKRTSKTTFLDEGKGNFWRLQNKINSDGFVDYIDIYFN